MAGQKINLPMRLTDEVPQHGSCPTFEPNSIRPKTSLLFFCHLYADGSNCSRHNTAFRQAFTTAPQDRHNIKDIISKGQPRTFPLARGEYSTDRTQGRDQPPWSIYQAQRRHHKFQKARTGRRVIRTVTPTTLGPLTLYRH